MFPLLYGVYLALGLLALQPYQDLGFSPLGAACLLVLGSALSTFLLSLGQMHRALVIERSLLWRVFLASLVQFIGLAAFTAGLLSGAGFYYGVAALLYGTIAGTVWSRFMRSRPASGWSRLGVVLASLAICVATTMDVGQSAAALGHLPLLSPKDIVARSLCFAGALLWGVSHFAFDARSFPAPRAIWNFWQSIFAMGIVVALGIGLSSAKVPSYVMSQGFSANPILIAPFLLFGIVLGTLRTRLVQAWESRLSAGGVHVAWVWGVVAAACAGGMMVLPSAGLIPHQLSVVLFGLCVYLLRHDENALSDYRGPQRVPAAPSLSP